MVTLPLRSLITWCYVSNRRLSNFHRQSPTSAHILPGTHTAQNLSVSASSGCSPALRYCWPSLFWARRWPVKERLTSIHRSAQKVESPKLNFRFTEFSEVRRFLGALTCFVPWRTYIPLS